METKISNQYWFNVLGLQAEQKTLICEVNMIHLLQDEERKEH